jgi:membrane-bound metal-dependent hydrolase YbcI (DUF457 family)
MLPDFLDKPIGSIFFDTGRWLGHALSFQFTMLLILTILARSQTIIILTQKNIRLLFFGSLLHLLGDMPSIATEVIFWPFLGPFPLGNKGDFLLGFQSTWTIVTEILGILIVLGLYRYENWGPKAKRIISLTLVSYIALFLVVFQILIGF